MSTKPEFKFPLRADGLNLTNIVDANGLPVCDAVQSYTDRSGLTIFISIEDQEKHTAELVRLANMAHEAKARFAELEKRIESNKKVMQLAADALRSTIAYVVSDYATAKDPECDNHPTVKDARLALVAIEEATKHE